MRIISGSRKGFRIKPPKGLPARPTTDRTKESLFNILENRIDFYSCMALDLFAGTGNISLELASRGARSVTAVEIHSDSVLFMKKLIHELKFHQIQVYKNDVFRFLKKTNDIPFDFIFADPPYSDHRLYNLPTLILKNNFLTGNGIFALEHASDFVPENHHYQIETRKYGQSSITFYSNLEPNFFPD